MPHTIAYDSNGREISGADAQLPMSQRSYMRSNPTPTFQQQVLGEQTSPNISDLAKTIKSGIIKWGGPDTPLATASAALAKAGAQLPDPYLPTIKAILETGGGKNITRGLNNLYNMNANSGGVNYPDYNTAILGGGTWGANSGPQKGLLGELTGPIYQDYMKSGNLIDLLKHFSPDNDNSSYGTQTQQYNQIRNYFQPQQP